MSRSRILATMLVAQLLAGCAYIGRGSSPEPSIDPTATPESTAAPTYPSSSPEPSESPSPPAAATPTTGDRAAHAVRQTGPSTVS